MTDPAELPAPNPNIDLSDNPFAALLQPATPELQNITEKNLPGNDIPENSADMEVGESQVEDQSQSEIKSLADEKLQINNVIQRIFLITVDKEPVAIANEVPSHCVYLPELSQDNFWLDWDNLDQGLFERLLMPNPSEHLIDTTGTNLRNNRAESDARETSVLHYLLGCYNRARKQHKQQDSKKEIIERCRKLIVSYSVTALTTPEVMGMDYIHSQIVDLFREKYTSGELDVLLVYLDSICQNLEDDAEYDLEHTFLPVLEVTYDRLIGHRSIMNSSNHIFYEVVKFFTSRPSLAKVLLKSITPRDLNQGREYEKNCLGCLLSLSCLVTTERGPAEFFDKPARSTQQEHNVAEASLWQPISFMNEKLYQLFLAILKSSPEIKHAFLEWLGNCLQANSGRAKIWNIMNNRHQFATDGFMLNLGSVLLQLCKPFTVNVNEKLMKIDPTYSKVDVSTSDEMVNTGVHMKGLAKETCLIQLGENEEPIASRPPYNFSTEIFFMTHRCLRLGFHCIYTQFTRLTRDLNRIQRAFDDARRLNQERFGGGAADDVVQRLKEEMDRGMTVFLCMKAALLEPQHLQLNFDLVTATSVYLSHYAVTDDRETLIMPTVPLPDSKCKMLTCMPELLAENILDLVLFLYRFNHQVFQSAGSNLHHLLTFITLYMGTPERMTNPHLRARMAETLETLMPSERAGLLCSMSSRDDLYKENRLAKLLSTALIHVFVSIECTGDPNQFEQKFNYRRPMYKVLDYVWKMDVHRDSIKELCVEAEKEIDAVNPPLFLRFINLLLNDSIFLLDEAFQLLTQVKDMQRARDNDEWKNLTTRERSERESMLNGYIQLTRFHNIMSNDTIHTLKFLTKEIQSIFTCPSMVDRVASMLNYFLLHLVGPKMGSLKVKDFSELDFKPQQLVADICQIYINLGSSEVFRAGVSSDGRSYNDKLFPSAIRVLTKIGRPELIQEVEKFAKTVKACAIQQEREEEILGDIPEEFLDPIMSTLMTDPVILPTSNHTVDRTTIARHLLSDQSDPFNRKKLSMEQVIPNTELKKKIDDWKQEHRKASSLTLEGAAAMDDVVQWAEESSLMEQGTTGQGSTDDGGMSLD
ncbi:ubiquitin conjugation factor E4 A-like [Glandiceps talaboti]